jgi:hypothetical protein
LINAVILLVLAACASEPVRPERPLAPLPRSSIAAVLEHAGELALSEDQVAKLQAMESKLEETDAALRAQLAPRRDAPPADRPQTGGRRGRGGGGMRRARSPEQDSARQQLDDNDTHAFLEAEAVFNPEQLTRAQELATKFREELFERREKRER